LKARVKNTEDAVQVMTLHVSKGLEFEAVFPIGLMLESKMDEPEELSEKMRQLYVAFTRAKRYLYLPLTSKEKTPIHFFLNKVLQGESIKSFVTNNPHFSLMTCHAVPTKTPQPAPTALKPISKTYSFSFPPCRVHSYSSLTAHTSSSESYVAIAPDQMPAGPEIGLILHKVFENLDFSKRGEKLRSYLEHSLKASVLAPWLEAVEQIVSNTLQAQLPAPSGAFCLADVNARSMIREMEFLYPSQTPEGYLKGFIDLFFEHQGGYYCLDWKSNFLIDYTPKSLEDAIHQHSYALQASIYQSAVHKYLKLFGEEQKFAGSFYLFLRGTQAHTDAGIHFFKKD
jgi:exodeoxyribonuclease V beta subunit